MKRLIILTILAAVPTPRVAPGQEAYTPPRRPWPSDEPIFAAPGWGCPFAWSAQQALVSGGEVGKLLGAVSDPAQRQKLAADWLQFSKQSIMRSHDLQKEWLDLQKAGLSLQRDLAVLRADNLKLQAEIQKLQVEKLRLEKENLELRLRLQSQTADRQKTD